MTSGCFVWDENPGTHIRIGCWVVSRTVGPAPAERLLHTEVTWSEAYFIGIDDIGDTDAYRDDVVQDA